MRFVVTGLLFAVLLGFRVPVAAAQESVVPQAPAATAPVDSGPVKVDPDALPVDLGRIQRRLARPPAIRTETSRALYRVEVFGRKPTIDEILGPDWRKGPTPAGPMTHQEFLNLVTPRDVQGYAAFSNREGMVVAATSFALQWAVKQAIQKLSDARTNRQKAAAQKEVDDALAALNKARREAGLPEK